jgi:DNA-binding beta-propeller fold protein YncE
MTTGEVKTIAGSSGKFGFADGAGPSSRFNDPEGIIADPSGTFLYVADTSNHAIRKIDMASHSVTTLAGQPGFLGFVDGSGRTARFDHPAGVAIDRSGTFLYITDSSNQAIRKISTASGEVTTIAGPAGRSERLFEKPEEIALGFPRGITLYQNDSLLFVSDTANHAIRQIDLATRKISTWNIPQAPHLALPQGILYDGINNFIFISNKATNSILKMALPSGMLTTLAGPDFQPPSSKK